LSVLSDKELLERMDKGDLKIIPFDPECLNPTGYDLHSLFELSIEPKQYALVATLERVELGLNIMAYIHLRSSFVREGIIGSFAVVDPGFRGQLTFALHNNGKTAVRIQKYERISQIVFHKLGKAASKGYHGVYQESTGIVQSRRKR